jgi:ribonuclease HI
MEEVILFFDGGIRRELMAYGYLAVDVKDRTMVFFKGSNTCGRGTSNIAEYRALIAGLKACLRNGIKVVHIFGDSQLIVKQVTGVFKVNKPELKRHRDYILELLKDFENWSLRWIPRSENDRADALVNDVFKRKFPKHQKR